jgi:hypothetical protein
MVFISSELDLDRDVPDGEIEVDSSDKPVVVDYLEEIMWAESDTSHEITNPIIDDWASGISWVKEEDWMTPLVDVTMDNEVQKVEAMYGV